jgi:D-psicose/D-tagatose/L-ribulose 3-epimerase
MEWADAVRYMQEVNHPGVQHINGDVHYMQLEKSHIGEAVLETGERLVNLHLADSNRCTSGDWFSSRLPTFESGKKR